MIKRYFIVVLLLSLLPAGVSAQRRAAAKKDWKTKYDYVGAVHNGRILVHRGGEGSNPRMGRFYTDGCFGYTDTCGTVVIPLIYDYADSFSNGFAVVGKGEKNDRRFGLIDRQGCEVVPCIYADVAGFSSGLARVQEGTDSVRRYGYVDTLGQVVIPLKYDYARDFSEGMAVVAKGEWSGKSGYGKRDFEFTGKYGFIDRRGNEDCSDIRRCGRFFRSAGRCRTDGEILCALGIYRCRRDVGHPMQVLRGFLVPKWPCGRLHCFRRCFEVRQYRPEWTGNPTLYLRLGAAHAVRNDLGRRRGGFRFPGLYPARRFRQTVDRL